MNSVLVLKLSLQSQADNRGNDVLVKSMKSLKLPITNSEGVLEILVLTIVHIVEYRPYLHNVLDFRVNCTA